MLPSLDDEARAHVLVRWLSKHPSLLVVSAWDEHLPVRFTWGGLATQLAARMLAVSCVASPGTSVRAIAGWTNIAR